MKRHFGNFVTRLLWGGTTLTSIEHAIIEALISQLPDWLKKTVNTQIDAYNLVQREHDGRALNFYRQLNGRANNMDGLPVLEMKKDESPLIALTLRFDLSGQQLHATMSAVRGRVFCVNFDRRIKREECGATFTVDNVRPCWKSDFIIPEESQNQPIT